MEKLEIIKDSFQKKCTGCSACKNACPVSAIEMKEGYDTFLYPSLDNDKCIGCKKCESVCPVLNTIKSNNANTKMYSVRADDEIRSVSSSGGVFSLVANYILEKGGYVCGAAFDENMKLRHRIVSDVSLLPALRGSKYLQSDIGNVYRDIEKFLKQDSTVLFVGTPCQVAALHNYLKTSYEKLYTIDILCHGVPSQKFLDLYLSDISNGKKVVNVEFRNKRFGWSAEHILVTFDDGSQYTKSRHECDAYLKAFFDNLDLRESCENCSFSEAPRHGDISIGDFWGIEGVDKSQNDGRGTSMLLTNNSKGEELLELVKRSAIVNEYEYKETLPNRIHSFFKASPLRYRFIERLSKQSFTNAVLGVHNDNAVRLPDKKFDVGLVCNYTAWNFGGSLTHYALFHVLEDMGYSTLLIERPEDSPESIVSDTRYIIYKKWPFDDKKCAPQFPDKESMRKLNDICESFVVGSDVLFRASLYNLMGKVVALDWVDNNKRKIAYSASYGYDYLQDGYAHEHFEMAHFMQQYDAFSTREKSGVELFKNNFGVDATWVLDPVFLCDSKHYDEIIENAGREAKSNYICAYILDPDEEKKKILQYCKSGLNKQVEVFSEFSRDNNLFGKELFSEFDHVNYTIEERLQSIKNCDFMVADSFHGICFALYYQKPFICVANKRRGYTRFESLLSHFGLMDRLVESFDDVRNNPDLLKPIKYKSISRKINNEVARCKKWLKDALNSPKRVGYSLYDVVSRMLNQKDREIELLKSKLQVLYSAVNALPSINSIDSYLEELKRVRDHSTIIVSVMDTPGIELSLQYGEKIRDCLGAGINLGQKHHNSYLFISHNGRVIFEELRPERIAKNFATDKFNIFATSAALLCGNMSEIVINDVNYSLNSRGLNIVTIDNMSGTIMDSVCFDTHIVPFKFVRSNKIKI